MKKTALILTGTLLTNVLLLTGCTDIRNRLSPDVLAVSVSGESVTFAAHSSESDVPVTASAAHPLMMCEALETAAGAEISTGHLSLLLLDGNPCDILTDYLKAGYLAPTSALLWVPDNACILLENGEAPTPEQMHAAFDNGLLPAETADRILGDLLGGSGVSVLPAYSSGRLTLAVFDGEGICALLSESACRGLALLSGKRSGFSFTAGDSVCRITGGRLSLSAADANGHLCFTVRGQFRTDTPDKEAAAAALRNMLEDALTETAGSCGADTVFLREAAVRDGIADAADCSQAAWRQRLRFSEYRAEITVT